MLIKDTGYWILIALQHNHIAVYTRDQSLSSHDSVRSNFILQIESDGARMGRAL